MVLVPEAMLNELKGKLPKPPEFTSTIGLRSDLDEIEHRDDLTEKEKVGLYGHQLHRYRQYLQQARHPSAATSSPSPASAASAASAGSAASAASPADDLESQIIKSVNKPGQKKAGLLLDHLKKSKVLTWNKEGEISYRGRRVPDSNIVDLMSETQRQKPLRHREPPAGLEQFAQALKETHAPKGYVTNRDVIKAMDKPGKISTPRPLEEEESGFQELTGFDHSFYETPQRMVTPKPIRDAGRKTARDIGKWLNLPS